MSENSEPRAPKPRRRLWLRLALAAAVLVVLAFGAIFVYAKFLNDAPAAFTEQDLNDLLGSDTTPSTAIATSFDGDWVPTDASVFGYRVEEVLAGVNSTAVGRSNRITGRLTISGSTVTALEVEVDVASIKSDDDLRDGKFKGSIMNTAEFPTATFVLTEPIQLDRIPTGTETITVTATGELTLRGATRVVTFDVTAQTTGGRIGALGSIPVVFADYGIDNPSFGPIRTEDRGLVEFVLVFDRA